MTISAIVPAAGCGARAKLDRNKVLAPLAGRPLLWWTLRALADMEAMPSGPRLLEIIIAARPDEFEEINAVIAALADATTVGAASAGATSTALPAGTDAVSQQPVSRPLSSTVVLRLVEGGASRQDSVAAAARAANGDFLMVHDAARPLATPALIARIAEAALRDGAAIVALPASDTIKSVIFENDRYLVSQTVERQTIWLAQTPQIFRRDILLEALARAESDSFTGTDCASLVERLRGPAGEALYPVTVVPGEERNFKVTYAADLERAARLLGA